MAAHFTPQTNLGVQTEVIRRADRFVGTCGSLAWLAPMRRHGHARPFTTTITC